MAQRSSNRERIERLAQEAEITRREKAASAAAKKTAPARKATRKTAAKPAGRTRVVWLVCDQSGSAVKTYPYPEEKDARGEAKRLTKNTGKSHFVTRGEVPFE